MDKDDFAVAIYQRKNAKYFAIIIPITNLTKKSLHKTQPFDF